MSKNPNQLPNCIKIAETGIVLICLNGILLPFLTVAQHESGTRKTISWSVTLYNKNVSSQSNLTVQI